MNLFNLNNKRTIYLLVLIMIISGIFGFVYETIFYRIDLGYFVKRGSSIGPWIPIYAFGGLLVVLLSYRFRNNPFILFIVCIIITGILEYFTGLFIYEVMGKRLWDYNSEIWNFGNVDGFICLRSLLFFGVSSLFLIYIVVPFILKITHKLKDNELKMISIPLALIFLFDIIIYSLIN